jgi:hypothetical protein
MSAYLLFMNSVRSDTKAEYPDAKFTEMGQLIGKKWKALTTEQQAPFKKEAEEYRRAHPEYGKRKPKKAAVTTKVSSVKKKKNKRRKVVIPENAPVMSSPESKSTTVHFSCGGTGSGVTGC